MAALTRLPPRLALAPYMTRLQPLITLRQASSSSIKPPRKPIVLEKPAKFNPPSHSSRLPTRRAGGARGATLPTYARSEKEKNETKGKKYPHMMPDEGTFLHWFLTTKSIHVWITMSILASLAFFTFITNFLTSTPYRDQLPPNNFFFSHPLAFLSQYVQVYKLHSEWVTQQTAEHRRQKVEDVRKRSEYRRAHGLESGPDGEGQGFGGWSVKRDEEVMGPGMKEGGDFLAVPGPPVPVAAGAEQGHAAVADADADAAAAAAAGDNEVSKKRPVKKWLGIW